MYVSIELYEFQTLVRQIAGETDFSNKVRVERLNRLVSELIYQMAEAEKPSAMPPVEV